MIEILEECVAPYSPALGVASTSRPPSPASPPDHGDTRVAPDSRDVVVSASLKIGGASRLAVYSRTTTFIGLDTGERKDKTVAFDGATFTPYATPVEAVRDARWTPGSIVCFENSACSFDPALRREFDATMRERGLVPYPINPRHTKNRRRDWGVEKSDNADAEVLRRIYQEGIIPRAPWTGDYRRKLSDDLLTRLRQVGYDVTHESVPQGFRDALGAVMSEEPPDHAIEAGAAEVKRAGARWVPGYRLLTPVVVAYEATSKRAAKARMRRRGLARSNAMYHPLKKKPRHERKAIMAAQDRLLRWCFDLLARRCELAVPTASRIIRATPPTTNPQESED